MMVLEVNKKPLVAKNAAPENVPRVVKLPPVMLPVALTIPLVVMLPPVMLPLALIKPVTYSPVVANTATLLVPAMVTVALAFELAMAMLLLPLEM